MKVLGRQFIVLGVIGLIVFGVLKADLVVVGLGINALLLDLILGEITN